MIKRYGNYTIYWLNVIVTIIFSDNTLNYQNYLLIKRYRNYTIYW